MDSKTKTFSRLNNEQLAFRPNEEENSIFIIAAHIIGNLKSRWIDFLTSDGEKEWRDRDAECEDQYQTLEQMLPDWEAAWQILFSVLDELNNNGTDLLTPILIRGQQLTVIEAINRQLAHYPYHIGQIVYLGKWQLNHKWVSLTIPKGNSVGFNKKMAEKQAK